MKDIEKLHTELGGRFVISAAQICEKLENIKAIIFDWDGVFNNGQKSQDGGSVFSEVDSMGTNLLRYSHYLKHQSTPLCAIISGEKNPSAFYFCERENFNYSFFKVANKINALNFICEKENIKTSEVAYFFDDVLDLSMAEVCGVRILINQITNPLFANYCIKNNLADYVTSVPGGQHAVRQGAELLMGLNGNFDKVISQRKNYDPEYLKYIELRKKTTPQFFTVSDNKIIEAKI